jgi:crotonobetainyl-CoA:carnitine CoA-transferase CaiB-like acyl-CoA transferase
MSLAGKGDGWAPLEGLKVLDFSLQLPGPFAALALGDLGADVIKVEPPEGDMARGMRFPMFRNTGRNKRSVTLDLKHPDKAAVVARLAAWADIALEGYRPGVARRLGIDYATLSAINPRLIYCSLTGYGQNGPEAGKPGHEFNYLAAAGTLVLSGHWGEPPRRSGVPMSDLAGGNYATIAILSALHERARTGCGAYLDLSITEVAYSYTVARHGPELDQVTDVHLWPTNDVFATADGESLTLGIVEEHFWRNFVEAVRDIAPDLAAPRYGDEPSRRARGNQLSQRLHELLKSRPLAEWMERFERCDVPAQRCLTPKEASVSPQLVARETVMEMGGERHVPFPVWANGRRGAVLRRLAPALGAHNREVLASLGFSASEVAAFEAAGLFGKRGA